jgi:DNA helicase-2/ATP-dependent DNA helicase PcrA
MQFKDDALLAGFTTSKTKKDPLEGLNPNQRLAAETTEGALVVLAGAGTGKTTTMVKRTAHMIQTKAARPDQILMVTFTRRAAGEMRGRLAEILGPEVSRKLTVGNFHAISSEILRRHAGLVNLPQKFSILDSDGQKDVIGTLALDRGYITTKKDSSKISAFQEQISSWKEEGWDTDIVIEKAGNDPDSIILDKLNQGPGFGKAAVRLFEEYQDMLELRKWCDFSDLVLHTVRIFRAHEDVRLRESKKFTHIVVDEYQDTSPVQNEWVRLMAKDHGNLCVVGDTDQSIYEWRNARPEIMLNFHNDWKGAKRITIDTNYRSSQEILDLANLVVSPLRAKDGLEKSLKSPRTGVTPKSLFQSYTSGLEEAESIARESEILMENGTKGSQIAVLCRSGMIINVIERAMRDRKLRYIVAGAMKFTDREEVKDSIAYLHLANNPLDFVALERVIGKPRRGIGTQKIGEIRRIMISQKTDALDALKQVAEKMSPRAVMRKTITEFAEFLENAHKSILNGDNCGQILETILEDSGYFSWREGNTKDPMKEIRIENIERIISEAQAYDSVVEFLESMTMQSAADVAWDEDSIVLSTVHASKGLEFDVVFTPAMENGIFPNGRAEQTSYGMDEERRLAHVAWTRPREKLYVSYAIFRPGRNGPGEASPYLVETNLIGNNNQNNYVDKLHSRVRRRAF